MYYVILHYIFMVHICNIKMSANSIRHISNSNYDIDDFIKQLLASQKFDELAEVVADKAVNKIKKIETPPAGLKRFSDENNHNKSESTSTEHLDRAYNKEVAFKNTKLRGNPQMNDIGKIDSQAVMKPEASPQADKLRLKYKYLTRNAYEKKVLNERPDNAEHNPKSTNKNEPEYTSKENVKKGSIEDVSHNTKGRVSNQDDPEKEQHGPKKEFDEEVHNRHENRDNDREEPDSNGNSHKHDIDGERNEESAPRHEKERPQEARSNKKSASKTEHDHLLRAQKGDDPPASFDEEKHEKVESSPEKSKEGEEDQNEEPPKSTQEDNGEHKEIPVLRAHENSGDSEVEKNKVVTSDDNLNDDQESSELITSSTKKLVTRIEGDRVFAFVEHPDYEEYHEELAKQEKTKKRKEQVDSSA